MDNYIDNKYNDLLYVNCYAKKDIICNSISKLKNGMCDKCYKDINHNLSEKELFENFISIKKPLVYKFKTLLNACDTVIGKNNKAKEAIYIFDVLYHNIYFTFASIKFIKTLINKIIELVKHDIKILNDVVDDYINYNNTYVDILDFIVNIYEHYKDINFNQLSDEEFLIDYNNFMKIMYNIICTKYNNEQSLNKTNNVNEIEKQGEENKKEENIKNDIYDNNFYNKIKPIQIDV